MEKVSIKRVKVKDLTPDKRTGFVSKRANAVVSSATTAQKVAVTMLTELSDVLCGFGTELFAKLHTDEQFDNAVVGDLEQCYKELLRRWQLIQEYTDMISEWNAEIDAHIHKLIRVYNQAIGRKRGAKVFDRCRKEG